MRILFKKGENKLVRDCVAGKPEAQRELYAQFSGKMMALCMRYGRNREEAEDILQEGFVRVFRKLDTFSFQGSLEGWIRRVITNVAIRQYQKNTRLHVAIGLDEVEQELSAEAQDTDFAAEDLIQMIRELPDGYRLVFNLYAIEGFSHKEIAKKLGISEGTSKSQLARARKSLQQRLEQQNGQISKKLGNEQSAI